MENETEGTPFIVSRGKGGISLFTKNERQVVYSGEIKGEASRLRGGREKKKHAESLKWR